MNKHFANIDQTGAIKLLKNITIIDIRDQHSYLTGHIEGALHITDKNIDLFVQNTEFDQTILVYCYHGHSSQHAAGFLYEQGFETVYSLIGGYDAWQIKGE
ncbi:thiosulfate sulfurtransferase GlpE [Eionea flava]